MDLPYGLRKPHRIAELIPVLLAMGVVAWATVAAWIHVIETTG